MAAAAVIIQIVKNTTMIVKCYIQASVSRLPDCPGKWQSLVPMAGEHCWGWIISVKAWCRLLQEGDKGGVWQGDL